MKITDWNSCFGQREKWYTEVANERLLSKGERGCEQNNENQWWNEQTKIHDLNRAER